ncbi:hypothetical protein [Paenibacillus silvae]|uniref:hypothetical protein n=1 Tax=Paenibacillus silvae TaxID=1325358 RepID=UPI002006AD4B|nr:hypothetical protein [Paenibacillus silvae]MCK6075394.1 hypothetical protein [Paenibacillus silvae]MCK6149781.1 hypothetical protein [Paenibacillus silvae]
MDFGRCHTKDIIGLGLQPKDIANVNKMKRLRQSVATKSWKDESPIDLHLYIIPEGKYTVCSGGNHRPYLANKLHIPSIEAAVDVVIPKGKITKDTAKAIEALRRNYQILDHEANTLNQYLKTQRFQRSGNNHDLEKKLDEMYNQLNQINIQIKLLLKTEAYLLGYIPKDWLFSDS